MTCASLPRHAKVRAYGAGCQTLLRSLQRFMMPLHTSSAVPHDLVYMSLSLLDFHFCICFTSLSALTPLQHVLLGVLCSCLAMPVQHLGVQQSKDTLLTSEQQTQALAFLL
jgi:hypothetical protein